jgi:hypothetical protein
MQKSGEEWKVSSSSWEACHGVESFLSVGRFVDKSVRAFIHLEGFWNIDSEMPNASASKLFFAVQLAIAVLISITPISTVRPAMAALESKAYSSMSMPLAAAPVPVIAVSVFPDVVAIAMLLAVLELSDIGVAVCKNKISMTVKHAEIEIARIAQSARGLVNAAAAHSVVDPSPDVRVAIGMDVDTVTRPLATGPVATVPVSVRVLHEPVPVPESIEKSAIVLISALPLWHFTPSKSLK